MGGEPEADIKVLRSQARRVGITIRTQRPRGGSKARAYSLIDRDSGMVIYSDIQALADLQTRLWWIVRDRRFALAGGRPVTATTTESCPSCGTSRVGQFRWCRSCGLDYESTIHQPSANVFERADVGMFPPPPRLTLLPPPRGRFGALRDAVSPSYHFSSWRELGIAAVVGLLVGFLVTILGGSR